VCRSRRSGRENGAVSITDHTRKVLWSLSGNECARCAAALVHPPEAAGDPHAIVGRECHIIAQAPSGPRGDAGERNELGGHENLVLLCANCHAVVDGQPEQFPPGTLRGIKAAHEAKIAARRNHDMPEVAIRGRGKSVRLSLIESGDSLLAMSGRSFAWAWEKPHRLSALQRQLVGDFMQSFSDWSEAYEEIGPRGQLEAGDALDGGLAELREEGLIVYAGVRLLTLEVADSSSPWPEAVIKIVHKADARAPDPKAPREPVNSAA
jgi:hypothetical protein